LLFFCYLVFVFTSAASFEKKITEKKFTGTASFAFAGLLTPSKKAGVEQGGVGRINLANAQIQQQGPPIYLRTKH